MAFALLPVYIIERTGSSAVGRQVWRPGMKRLILMGALVGAFAASTAFAQSGMSGTTPLGSVHINMNVLADGKPLPAGTYQVRLTPDEPKPGVGQSPGAEQY